MDQRGKQARVDDRDDTVARIYDVALDPGRYEELLESRERSVPTLKRAVQGSDLGALTEDEGLNAHIRRAEAFLDKLTCDTDDRGLEIPSEFDKVAALMIDKRLEIVAANSLAQGSLGIGPAGRLASRRIEPQDRGDFAKKDLRNAGDARRAALGFPRPLIGGRRLHDPAPAGDHA